ncbi:hypothetical protein [Pedobacter nototheniae]|uniref:hypothetical protein n=1 Tax=Pedobacter nototheniae TaxID=2488994 RepID=UPI00292DF4E7|nr:hypothetical protein [Pedobacter nototheniae]
MKSSKLLLLLLFVICISTASQAQSPPKAGSACYYPSFGQIYQTVYSGTDFVYDNGNGPYSYLQCSNKTVLQASGTCRVRIPNGQPQGGSYYPGQLFTITKVIPCGIDDYAFLLMIPAAAVAYISFNKRLV